METFKCHVLREPIGVVGLITPWNYPMLMATWKVAPALAAGCTAILKPSELASVTCLELADVGPEVGLHRGVLNVLTGWGPDAGTPLASHPHVDKIAFTGSNATGRKIMTAAEQLVQHQQDLGGAAAVEGFMSEEKQLERVIWSFICSEGYSEARLWLCITVSGINSISPRHQRDLFMSLLRSKPIKWHLASQLLQLIFEKQPRKMGPIIAKKSCKLENFFKGNPRRILQWFSDFAGLDHGKGAKALSQFAFVNRDICWEELQWKGKHGLSPAMVAAKPHYFLDLDVQRTVENFIVYVPEFWSSHEFSEL